MAGHGDMLGSFELITPLSNQNSGFSVWGFARREGNDYFVKQFLNPIYPDRDQVSSPERIEKKIKQCRKFEREKTELYKALNDHSDGNAMRVQEFFRVGSHYYTATKKLHGLSLDIDVISNMNIDTKRLLCATIAHAVSSFHNGHVVHADLKHANIMYVHSSGGNLTAKVIDFDSSFLESAPPAPGEEIVGDQVYFSPEACLSVWGEEVPLTCKMDVFSLGILFHQYFTGELPGYSEYFYYPGEAVANGETLQLSVKIPEFYRSLIQSMLDYNPENRPSAYQVFCCFMQSQPVTTEPTSAKSFFTPGDL